MIILITAAVISMAADRDNLIIKYGMTELSRDVSLNASDTTNTSETTTFTIINRQRYAQNQTFTVGLEDISGTPSVVITAYGKVTSAGSWVAIGSAITWTSDSDDGDITSTTPINYNYLKVEFVASGATQQTLIDEFEVKTSNAFDIPANSGTLTVSRATSGTVTITSADDDANAALTLVAGGTGALTLGDSGSTTAVTSSDWGISATGVQTGMGTISSGKVSSSAGVDLGTSQALTGTTALTIGAGTETVAVNSSDWDIDATGNMSGIGTIGMNDRLTVTHATSTDVSALPVYLSETLSADFGDASAPAYGMTVYSKIEGANLAATDAYESALTGLYGITGTNASVYPKAGVLAWIADNTTTADGAFVALIDGDTQVTQAGAAYAVRNLNSTPTSGFGYGLDLYSAAIGIYDAVEYRTADVRFVNGETFDNSLDKNIISNGNFIIQTPSPNAINSTDAITAAQMLGGVITSTSGAATALTTPTATAIMALIPNGGRGTTFDLIIDNSAGSSTITLTLDGSISVNTPAITGGDALTVSTANTVGLFRFYFVSGTAAKVFRIY